MNFIRKITILLLAFATLVGCNRAAKTERDTLAAGKIAIAVDETFSPIIKEEIAAFEDRFIQAEIITIDTSEASAINLILADSVHLAITTRPLTAGEENYLKSKQFQPKSYVLALDGIALIVNPNNRDTLITIEQLQKILLGEITQWKQIYPNSRLGELSLVFDDANSSTVRFLKDSICGGQKLSEQNLYSQKSNRNVIEYVANNQSSIGIIGVSWLSERDDSTKLSFDSSVKLMSVSNEKVATAANSYKPYQYYLYYGYYPLTRNIYIIHNDPYSGLATGFTRFLTGDIGQRIIHRAGLVPATQPLRIVSITE
jgi:phosphate transport system substrate-binding protein